MGGSNKGGSRSDNSIQRNSPPDWALPLFKKHAADGLDIYNSGEGGNVYQGQRVADLGDQTNNAIGELGQVADQYKNNKNLQTLLNDKTSSAENLDEMASGKYLKEGNPYYKERLNGEIEDMANKVNSQMSGAGRVGSGANTQALAKNTADMLLKGLDKDYDRANDNYLLANSLIDKANQNQMESVKDVYQGLSNTYKNALNGGLLQDENAQQKLDANRDKWLEEDNRDWNRLNFLQNLLNGSAGDYGTKTTDRSTKNSPNMTGLAGNFLSKLIRK